MKKIATLAFFLSCCCITNALGEMLIFFEENGGAGNPRGLYNFDTETGVVTLRAPVGGSQRFFGLDIRQSDGTAFILELFGDLYTIDLDTGNTTFIGSGGSKSIGLTIDPLTDNMFTANYLGDLHSVNRNDGTKTLLGNVLPVTRGLAYSPTGQLFGFDDSGPLYEIDPARPSHTLIGGNNFGRILEDATITGSGRLFVADFIGDIYEINSANGAETWLGNTGMGYGLLGLTAMIIPEPSSILLVAMGAVGLLLRVRKQY